MGEREKRGDESDKNNTKLFFLVLSCYYACNDYTSGSVRSVSEYKKLTHHIKICFHIMCDSVRVQLHVNIATHQSDQVLLI